MRSRGGRFLSDKKRFLSDEKRFLSDKKSDLKVFWTTHALRPGAAADKPWLTSCFAKHGMHIFTFSAMDSPVYALTVACLRVLQFELSAGDTFGDLAVTGRNEDERRRTATIRCKDECLFATLTRAAYLKVSGQLEESAYAVLRKDPFRRKEADLALLSSFFAELDFFKNLHFPLLQSAISKNMTIRALDAKEALFEQKEWSEGVFYILLRGRLKV